MKNKTLRVFWFALLLLTFIPFFGHADQPSGGFEGSSAWKKLDAPTQQAWLAAKASGDMTMRIDCFVRVQSPYDSGDEDFLVSNGYNVRAVAGTVATGFVQAQNLPSVAGLPFVESVKLSTKKR